jgi:hypothetical protein
MRETVAVNVKCHEIVCYCIHVNALLWNLVIWLQSGVSTHFGG